MIGTKSSSGSSMSGNVRDDCCRGRSPCCSTICRLTAVTASVIAINSITMLIIIVTVLRMCVDRRVLPAVPLMLVCSMLKTRDRLPDSRTHIASEFAVAADEL